MYIENNLLKDEKIVYWVRPHWVIFFSPVAIFIIAVALTLFGNRYFNLGLHVHGYSFSQILTLSCYALAVGTGLAAFIRHQTSEYAVTTKRILMKTGWISRNVLELFLVKIEALHVTQSIPARVLGYGTVVVIGTGGTRDPFATIPNPLHFRRVAQRLIDQSVQKLSRAGRVGN